MNPRVLIFFQHQLREHHGGAYSYLFHLKEGLKNRQHSISFLSDSIKPAKETHIPGSQFSFLKKIIRNFIPQIWINNKRAENWFNELEATTISLPADYLNDFDIVHFHESIDIWRYRYLLKNFKGKILFTSHTPKPYHLELIEDVWKISPANLKTDLFQRLIQIDQFACKRADAFVFPCKEAIDSYYELWPEFSGFIQQKQIQYLATGIKKQIPVQSASEIRTRFNIPADAFTFCFAGRKSPVKGYDLFVQAAKELLAENNDVCFLIAGNKEQIPAIKDERWIETGWTDNPQDIIAASDLLVVPNRHTFFDLSVLEAISMGKPILLSETGGNKYFRQFNSPGILFCKPETDSLKKEMINVFNKKNTLPGYGKQNEELHQSHFNNEKFAAGLIDIYNAINE